MTEPLSKRLRAWGESSRLLLDHNQLLLDAAARLDCLEAEVEEFAKAKLVIIGFVFNCKCSEGMKNGDLLDLGRALVARNAALEKVAEAAHDLKPFEFMFSLGPLDRLRESLLALDKVPKPEAKQ